MPDWTTRAFRELTEVVPLHCVLLLLERGQVCVFCYSEDGARFLGALYSPEPIHPPFRNSTIPIGG